MTAMTMTSTPGSMIALDYQEQAVRVINDPDGPWFVAADVARILGYRDAANLTRRLDDDDRGTRLASTPGGRQMMAVISEAGLYAAILGSHVPGARGFKRWLTHEVLPSLRRTGTYSMAPKAPSTLEGPELLARAVLEAQAVLAAKDEQIASQARQIEAAAPKTQAYDAFIAADDSLSIGTAAKMLGLGQNKLFEYLRETGVLIPSGHMRNTPYAQHAQHFKVIARTVETPDGMTRATYTTRINAEGVAWLQRRLARHQELQGVAA